MKILFSFDIIFLIWLKLRTLVDHNIYYLQLSKLQDERSSMQDQLRDYEDRINAMTSHFKNVKQEFLFTQVQY